MESLFTFITQPSPCGYLPDRDWQLQYEVVRELTPADYFTRLQAGWRRFGYALFRPVCPTCQKCQSLRIPVVSFQPNRSQRRALAANDGQLRLHITPPQVTSSKLELYDRFHHFQHQNRGWPIHTLQSAEEFADSFVNNPFEIQEWSYYLDDKLVGVGYVDPLPQGLSAIYFFHDPTERKRSLGIYNVLSLIRAAQQHNVPYVYLGYYVEGCRSLEYKAHFRPHELLQPDGTWQPSSD